MTRSTFGQFGPPSTTTTLTPSRAITHRPAVVLEDIPPVRFDMRDAWSMRQGQGILDVERGELFIQPLSLALPRLMVTMQYYWDGIAFKS
ncbi:hypothetical protein N7532_009200 [Penicillium argentinense]|uniref:Uncharacterized protein n=1 Tax=Penicillium argentinense TaxID=1131581 RepID=A0A9W9EZ38_9EURO|nr:uncharacterized protein N7532_009200 [Penicillium argentinense]KAJ5090516.1 hypothetical protein N7532_009200 [Penicillium argentinense]